MARESAAALPLLYVDDEPGNLTLFRLHFENEFPVRTAGGGAEALEILEREEIAVLLSEERMPNMSGVDLLARAWQRWPDTVRIIVSAYTDAGRILGAINRGHAHEYIVKPWNEVELRGCVERSLEMAARRRRLSARGERLEEDLRARNDGFVGIDGSLHKLAALARRAAAGDSTVLLPGETGTGKEARDAEAARLREVLLFHGGNCARAAAALGIPRTTRVSRLKKHGLL